MVQSKSRRRIPSHYHALQARRHADRLSICYNGTHPWRYRLMVRTEPSQGLNTGSTPVSATNSSYTSIEPGTQPFQQIAVNDNDYRFFRHGPGIGGPPLELQSWYTSHRLRSPEHARRLRALLAAR